MDTRQPTPPPVKHFMLWASLTLLLATLAYAEVSRVQQGNLFLLSLPSERQPTNVERMDAELSASENKFLAPIAVLGLGFLVAIALRPVESRVAPPIWLITVFLVAALLDLATTLHFFHRAGIQNELHPGIRLVGYAYGRTTGPIIGKSIQVIGLLMLSRILPKYRGPLLSVASVLYIAAAIYNFMGTEAPFPRRP